ncbi:hypothetical protein M9978_16925 [Sphingomonas sp. MG17]|uniref:Cupin n=1 Tax=Sphingomonas tagetis TaxID=2949092 RepID=A0A9X2HRC6_9SPHN|nr:hypothetical protein [Sphingomonas tagetis]MCP3732108.1 hypothetical protein [Sphingomonas tagetis]
MTVEPHKRSEVTMKIWISAALPLAAIVSGAGSTPAIAQSGANPIDAPLPKIIEYPEGAKPPPPEAPLAKDGTGMIWSGEKLQQAFGGNVDVLRGGIYAASTEYRLMLVQRPYLDAGKVGAEFHQDHTQIYFILAGSGTAVLGGTPDVWRDGGDGHRFSDAGPLKGGTSRPVKAGDIILVPPSTWHQTFADKGSSLNYHMVHIYTRRRLP